MDRMKVNLFLISGVYTLTIINNVLLWAILDKV